MAVVSGKGSGRVSAAGLACFKPGSRSRFFYRIRIHRGRKGERRSLSEADYAGLVTAAHCQLKVPVILVWDGRFILPLLQPRMGMFPVGLGVCWSDPISRARCLRMPAGTDSSGGGAVPFSVVSVAWCAGRPG